MLTIEDLVEWVKADPADSETIAQLRDAAVAHVESETGMRFGEPGEVVDSLTGWPLSLRGVPVEGEDFVLERWAGSAWETVGTDAYYIDGAFVRPATADGLTMTDRYRATYTAGYVHTTQPEPVKLAVRMLVQAWYDGDTSEETMRAIRLILAPYRKVVV